ncbi:hypothetical protein [Chondromyces apiculatus]|uniref:hypothetical protein n=1 Tax=Chondromyces apiculatus TaxID=51 RepID=UPI0018CC40B6|nr:hypothetical protein [Chondromyces apiculatus]
MSDERHGGVTVTRVARCLVVVLAALGTAAAWGCEPAPRGPVIGLDGGVIIPDSGPIDSGTDPFDSGQDGSDPFDSGTDPFDSGSTFDSGGDPFDSGFFQAPNEPQPA